METSSAYQTATHTFESGNKKSVNIGKVERWATVLGGAALAALALKRRSKGTLGLALAGAPLIWRGATGHCPVYEKMGIDRSPQARTGGDGLLRASATTGDPLLHGSAGTGAETAGGNGRSPLATGLPADETGRDPIGASF